MHITIDSHFIADTWSFLNMTSTNFQFSADNGNNNKNSMMRQIKHAPFSTKYVLVVLIAHPARAYVMMMRMMTKIISLSRQHSSTPQRMRCILLFGVHGFALWILPALSCISTDCYDDYFAALGNSSNQLLFCERCDMTDYHY